MQTANAPATPEHESAWQTLEWYSSLIDRVRPLGQWRGLPRSDFFEVLRREGMKAALDRYPPCESLGGVELPQIFNVARQVAYLLSTLSGLPRSDVHELLRRTDRQRVPDELDQRIKWPASEAGARVRAGVLCGVRSLLDGIEADRTGNHARADRMAQAARHAIVYVETNGEVAEVMVDFADAERERKAALSRKGADARHKGGREKKAAAQAWWAKNRGGAGSKNKAAAYLADKLGESFETVRNWLKEPKEQKKT